MVVVRGTMKKMAYLRDVNNYYRTFYTLLISQSLHLIMARNFGPQVDPGVFVITHIDSCRNGAGYCILGYTCSVDKDFVADDLGGHCRGLSKAFNPKASFVCCRENPKTKEPNKSPVDLQHIIDAGYSEAEEVVNKPSTESSSSSSSLPSTSISPSLATSTRAEIKIEDSALPATTTSKEIGDPISQDGVSETQIHGVNNVTNNEVNEGGDETVNEVVMMASVDTQVVELEEKEQMRPGIVLDGEPPLAAASTTHKYMLKNESVHNDNIENRNDNKKPSINCFAAILLGIKCEINGIDENTQKKGENTVIPFKPLLSTEIKEDDKEPEFKENSSGMVGEIIESSDNDKIMTVKKGLIPDRDEVFLNKPVFVSPASPVPLGIINDEINEDFEQDDRNQINASIEPSNYKSNQKVRLPENPLVSTLGQDVVTLNNTKENSVNFTMKEVLAPAQPLSIMLSSNRINVGLKNSTQLNNSTNGTTNLLVNHTVSSTNTNGGDRKSVV